MTLRVGTTPEADDQVRAIDVWWRENRLAARDLFLHELAAVFETIGHTPHLGRVYRQSPVPGTRRILLKRCRYHVYYVVHGGEITVLAVWHAGRGAGPPLRMS